MKQIQKSKEKIVFAKEVSESLANAIRRTANEIPILAAEEIEFVKNDSALYDEIIAHRLGLVPLKRPKGMNFPEECTCKGKGCSKCQVKLKISKKGPGIVYAEDIKGSSKVEVVHGKIPIVLLKKDQELKVVLTAQLGQGIDHAKFSPGLIYFRNVAELEVDKNCNACKECVNACPQGVLKFDKKLEFTDKYKCDLCEACVEACKKHDKNALKIKPGKELMFFIESWGQIDAKDIFLESIDIINKNLKEIDKKVK